MPPTARELASATQLFLARHAEALASGEGSRTLEAVEGLLLALDETLPAEIDAISGADERARAVLRRRMAECEGVLMQLRLALRNLAAGQADAFRLVALLTAARATLRGLEQTLLVWAEAELPAPEAGACLRAARESLLAGAPEAAGLALRRALDAVRVPEALEPEARDLARALDAGTPDLVAGWAMLDAVDALWNRAATFRPPPSP